MSTENKERVTAEVDGRLDEFFSDDEDLGEKTHELETTPVSKDESLDDLLSDEAWDFDDAAPAATVALDPNADAMDDFLAEDTWADGPPAGAPRKTSAEELGIQDLQIAILSLDWEITDEVVDKLVTESTRLKLTRSGDPISVTFLALMETLGKYIKKRKAAAHPESVSLIRAVYDDLEKVLSMKGMDDESRRQIALADVARFVRLKAKITALEKKRGKPVTAKKPVPRIKKAEIIEEIPVGMAEITEELPVRKAEIVEDIPLAVPAKAAPASLLSPGAAADLRRELDAVKEELLAEIRALPAKMGQEGLLAEIRALPEKIEAAVAKAVAQALSERS